MNRRFFLRSAGGAVLAAPILASLGDRARAEAPPSPKRSVIFHSPSGCLTTRWFPQVEDGPLDAAALDGTSLEVLTPYLKKLLFPRGLRSVNQYGKPQTHDPHAQSMGGLLTCAMLDSELNSHYPKSHSLDWEIARQLNPDGAAPLVLAVGSKSMAVQFVLSYSAAGTPTPPYTNPSAVYGQLKGVLGGGPAEPDYRARRKESIIDAVREDLDTYRRVDMSLSDKQRIDAWLALLRDTEVGLSACDEQRVGLDRVAVEQASLVGATMTDQFTLGADEMIKLMALSMLCDTNRSFVLSFTPYAVFDWDGIQHKYDHDALAHRSGSGTTGGACVAGVLDMLLEIDRWYAAKFAKLVGLLDSLPEGDVSLLDNTATTWLHELSDGSVMNQNNLPIVIAGSAGGYLKQGVAVNVEGGVIGPGNSEGACQPGGTGIISLDTGSERGNVPINKLYVTLLNALGCTAPGGGPVTTFGQLDTEVEADGITQPGELTALKA